MDILNIVGLQKKYDGKIVLDIDSLCVESGKITGYLGRNGAGKSTTMRAIMGIELPTSGQIYFMDKKIDYKSSEYKKDIGYCPDYPSVFEKLTVFEHLSFICYLYGLEDDVDIQNRINKYLKHYDIEEYENSLIQTLSRGNKQKIAIISSIIHNPKLLIYDEPTLGLDPISIKQFKDMLKEYISSNGSVFISSHALDIIEEVSDTVNIIEKGRLIRKNISVKDIRSSLTSIEEYLISAVEN